VTGISISGGADAGNYNLHNTSATASAKITPRPITVKANDVSRVYGSTTPDFTLAVFAGSLGSGDAVGDLGAASFATGAPATGYQAVGSYAIVVTGLSNGNYNISYAAGADRGRLTITLRPLTITASSPADIVLGSPIPTVTPIYAGFVTGEDGTSLASNPTCNTPYTTTSPVGTYSTSCSGAASTNYSFTYIPGSFKVKYAIALCLGSAGHTILQPINADGSSVSKQGSTIPAKFRVCDVNGVSIGTAGVVTSFSLVSTTSGLVTTTVDDGTVTSTTPDTAFRWDSSGQQWIFNINTKAMATNKTYLYRIVLNDGTKIEFQFGLIK
jgi:hypothetical protein